jgi:hypothetical protein
MAPGQLRRKNLVLTHAVSGFASMAQTINQFLQRPGIDCLIMVN